MVDVQLGGNVQHRSHGDSPDESRLVNRPQDIQAHDADQHIGQQEPHLMIIAGAPAGGVP